MDEVEKIKAKAAAAKTKGKEKGRTKGSAEKLAKGMVGTLGAPMATR